MGKPKITILFDGKNLTNTNEDYETSQKRINVIDEFIEIARDYVVMNVFKLIDVKGKCFNCGYETSSDDDDGLRYCSNCRISKYDIVMNQCSDSISTVDYDDYGNFEKSLNRLQGLEKIKLPIDMFDKLDAHFRKARKPLGEEIRNRPLLPNGKKEGTSVDLLIDALKCIEYEKYYENFIYILHKYWVCRCPDISKYEDDIRRDYMITQKAYGHIDTKRSSSLNLEFRKLKHLELLGIYPKIVDREFFRLPIGIKALLELEEDWRKICDMVVQLNGEDTHIVYKSLY